MLLLRDRAALGGGVVEVRRGGSLTSAIAFAAASLTSVRKAPIEETPVPQVVDVVRYQRCTCPDCVKADATDKYGYFQWRLPLSGGSWR
jgi:hypothetical protein